MDALFPEGSPFKRRRNSRTNVQYANARNDGSNMKS